MSRLNFHESGRVRARSGHTARSSYTTRRLARQGQLNRVSVGQVFCRQRGASLVEFSIVALSVLLVALFTLQLGLLYHARTTVNYAVFEAARAGAVNNASMSAIRTELGIRLAPLQGGDGSENKALSAVARSSFKVLDAFNTRIVILNPTKAAFRDWAVRDPVSGKRFIPVNHLRHQTYAIGRHSGLSLRDANILKLQVTHGVDLHVPVVGKLMARSMRWLDSANAVYYLRGKWPIQSVATVRMQSDSLEAEILKSASSGEGTGGSSGGSSGGSGASGGNAPTGTSGPESTEGSGGLDATQVVDASESAQDSTAGQATETVAHLPPAGVSDCQERSLTRIAIKTAQAYPSEPGELINTSQFRQMLAQHDLGMQSSPNLR